MVWVDVTDITISSGTIGRTMYPRPGRVRRALHAARPVSSISDPEAGISRLRALAQRLSGRLTSSTRPSLKKA